MTSPAYPPRMQENPPSPAGVVENIPCIIPSTEGQRANTEGEGEQQQRQIVLDRTCQYVRGGHCLIHGRGGTRKWRGGYVMSRGRGGVPVKRYQRDYYYTCDPVRGGRGRGLIQTRLSFKRVTESPLAEDANLFKTSTEGQNRNCTELGRVDRPVKENDEK